MAQERFTVEHREGESRYVLLDHEANENDANGNTGADPEARVIGEERYVTTDFGERPQRVLHHTFVDPEYGGQGLAAVLVRATVDDSIEAGFDIVPVCPYVVKWVAKHPDEYAGRIVKATPRHLDAITR